MKKLLTLFTLLLTVCSGAWGDDYVLDNDSKTSNNQYAPITFTSNTLDFTVNDGSEVGKNAAGAGNDKTEKYRKNKTYTIKVPSNLTVTSIKFKGYTNATSGDKEYITKINGVNPTRNSETVINLSSENFPYKGSNYPEYTYDATKDANNEITFTTSNGANQACLIITIVGTVSAAPGAISFDPAAGSVEENTEITLTSTGATQIKYQWGASAVGSEGSWESATTYSDGTKPKVPAVGSTNNVLSVWAHNNDGDTYGSATYTITAAKTVTTTTINSTGITNLDVKTSKDAGTLTASVTAGVSPVDGATVTWSSDDESVATVGETTGVVTLVAAGDANITATYAGDETHAASFDVYAIEVKDTRKHVTLSFSTTSITDYNFDGETLTAPTLTAKDQNDNTIDLAELPELSFAESHEDKVTPTVSVDAKTGAITAANTNNFGTSTVTVSFPGNSNYKSAASKSYTVTRAPMLYQVKFDNGFEGFIEEGTKKVNVFYMAGTSAPAQTGTIKKADGYTATVVDNTVVLTKDTHTKTYIIDAKAKTPFEGTGKQTFDGTESYVASGYGWDDTKKWKFSKTDNDWTREAPGKTRLYFFVGAATNLQLSESGLSDRNINVYVNGVKDETITSIEKNKSITITLNPNQVNMVEIQSNQTGGDGGFKDMTLTSPKKAVKIGSHGWTSLISDKNLNFEGIDGLNAYAAKLNETTVTLNDVTEVPANKGIVLRGTENETYYVPVLASTDADVDTDLTGNATAAYNKDGEKYYYVLANKGGVEGFYEYTGDAAIPAGKAFFETSSKIAAGKFSIVFADDETDGIKSVQGSRFTVNGEAYNLAGQKVGADYKGIIVVNGKKYLNK